MDQSEFDADRVATVKIAMDNELSMLLDTVAELYGLTYTDASTLALGFGLAAMESEWGRAMVKKMRSQGPQ